jgi:hypothetical protein
MDECSYMSTLPQATSSLCLIPTCAWMRSKASKTKWPICCARPRNSLLATVRPLPDRRVLPNAPRQRRRLQTCKAEGFVRGYDG